MLDSYGLGQSEATHALETMSEWYDNYSFSGRAERTLFNTDMVLYFMVHYLRSRRPPDNMVDSNVRIDYGKPWHLIVLDKRSLDNWSNLERIIRTRQVQAAAMPESFPAEQAATPENFVSLLFHFGLLSYVAPGTLRIPNQTVAKLKYGYLRDGYKDADVFAVDPFRLANLIRDMAFEGNWKPAFRFWAGEVKRQTSIKDFLTGEKVVQTFLLAYLNVVDYYVTKSEEEMGKGFTDLFLGPFSAKYPELKYSYLVELKYMKRGEFTERKLEEHLLDAEKPKPPILVGFNLKTSRIWTKIDLHNRNQRQTSFRLFRIGPDASKSATERRC